MVSTRIGVTPVLPTIAGLRQVQLLAGNDLLLNVPLFDLHYVPAIIDIERFKGALAQTLHYYPEFAGRIRHETQGDWWIQLSNSPVPLEVSIREHRDPQLDYDYAVFDTPDDIATLIIPIDHDNLINGDSPLITFKLSIYPATNESMIGVATSHIIADGFSTVRFMSCVSALYQGLSYPFPSPILNPPLKFRVNQPLPPPPSAPVVRTQLSQSDIGLNIRKHFPPDVVEGNYARQEANSLPVRLRVTKAQMSKLRERVMVEVDRMTGSRGRQITLSKSDVMAGLVVATMNRFIATPVEYVWSTIDIRPIAPPEALTNNMLTARPSRHIPVDPNRFDPKNVYRQAARIALAIRLAVLDSRAPDSNILTIFWLSQKIFREAADRGDVYTLANTDGFANVNSLAGFPFNEAVNFGLPGRVKHWIAGCWDRYMRIFPSNPELGRVSSGSEERGVLDARSGSIDVHFRVEKEKRDEVEAAMGEILGGAGVQVESMGLVDARL